MGVERHLECSTQVYLRFLRPLLPMTFWPAKVQNLPVHSEGVAGGLGGFWVVNGGLKGG